MHLDTGNEVAAPEDKEEVDFFSQEQSAGGQGWKLMSCSHCLELCHLQASWLLIGCTRVNNATNQKPGQQVDTTLDMTTTHKFPLQATVDLVQRWDDWFDCVRQPHQTMEAFVEEYERVVGRLEAAGHPLAEETKGLVLMKKAGLNTGDRAQILSSLTGSKNFYHEVKLQCILKGSKAMAEEIGMAAVAAAVKMEPFFHEKGEEIPLHIKMDCPDEGSDTNDDSFDNVRHLNMFQDGGEEPTPPLKSSAVKKAKADSFLCWLCPKQFSRNGNL